MPALDDIVGQKTSELQKKQLRRRLIPAIRTGDAELLRNGKKFISFSCNDYLGLSHHPQVIGAACDAALKYGVGAGASRLVTGNHPLYAELESILAGIKGMEASLVFGSGYMANIGILPALVKESDLILADKFIHACLLDGAALSGAKLLRFAHNNLDHCEELLIKHRSHYKNCLLITERVFSMDGDVAPLSQLSLLARKHAAWLLIDDAHGLGILPHDNNIHVDIYMGTFSKAVGAYGGYICGSRTLVNYLITRARSLIYSTGLPPMILAAAIAALHIMQHDDQLIQKPLNRARLFTSLLGLPGAQSAIVPLILGETSAALNAAAALEEEGFLVAAIRPPTVPEGTARLRFAFSAIHKEEDIHRLADSVKNKGWLA